MTDRELLELAALAAGIDPLYWTENGWLCETQDSSPRYLWNPLTNDGDALRLAVKLRLGINITSGCQWTSITYFHHNNMPYVSIDHNDDAYAATRRAIVRAAAEIGKEMK